MRMVKYVFIGIFMMCIFLPVTVIAQGSGFRGTNMPGIWYESNSLDAYSYVSSNGFNAVRIVWETKGSASGLSSQISAAKNAGLSVIVELHDVTGSDSTSELSRMADYWCQSDVRQVLSSNSDIMVNIANEWGSHSLSDSTWYDAYSSAIQKMRNAGIRNTIVVDASGWGQNESPIINRGRDLMSVDSNILLDLHMYGSWNDSSKISNRLSEIRSLGIPLIVGEFGYNYNNGDNNLSCQVDAATVMSSCRSNNFGYLGWSWCGNNSENAWLDMTDDWRTLNTWGNLVKSGGSGGGGSTTSAPTSPPSQTNPPSGGGGALGCGTCIWYGTEYPLCCTTTSGWGWESNTSCISRNECERAGQTVIDGGGTTTDAPTPAPTPAPTGVPTPAPTTVPTTPPSQTSPPSTGGGGGALGCGTCVWYGTEYPLCCTTTGGWGWENNTSCISRSTCEGAGQTVIDGGGGGSGTAAPTSPPSSTDAPTSPPSSGGGTGATCSGGTTISVPFTQNGAGEYCWIASSIGNYVNSWNLELLEVNGVDFTNKFASPTNLPAKIDGSYYIYYIGNYSWSHFEAR